ncbi:transposase [Streptomyces pulveraceus]|uniref:Transposase n=1 Tax=Streptomyces pulveraceus TaxID=68258 RepID=A0ABW1GFY6_9ACTN
MVTDRHSAHLSKAVRTWLADHKVAIELRLLPPYSPKPNPDELINADLKRSLSHAHGPGTRPNSPPKPAGSSTVAKRQPHIVRGYLGGRHVHGSRPPKWVCQTRAPRLSGATVDGARVRAREKSAGAPSPPDDRPISEPSAID